MAPYEYMLKGLPDTSKNASNCVATSDTGEYGGNTANFAVKVTARRLGVGTKSTHHTLKDVRIAEVHDVFNGWMICGRILARESCCRTSTIRSQPSSARQKRGGPADSHGGLLWCLRRLGGVSREPDERDLVRIEPANSDSAVLPPPAGLRPAAPSAPRRGHAPPRTSTTTGSVAGTRSAAPTTTTVPQNAS